MMTMINTNSDGLNNIKYALNSQDPTGELLRLAIEMRGEKPLIVRSYIPKSGDNSGTHNQKEFNGLLELFQEQSKQPESILSVISESTGFDPLDDFGKLDLSPELILGVTSKKTANRPIDELFVSKPGDLIIQEPVSPVQSVPSKIDPVPNTAAVVK